MRGRIFRTGSIEKNRLEAFSDGVLAIVITLLVLDLKVPEGIRDEAALWRALAHALPAFGAWTVSFLFVLVFWVSHHYFITSLKHADRGLLWLNGLFLLFISSTPFPTGLVGTYPGMTPALVLLSASMFGTAFTFAAMRFYATYHGSLVGDHITPDQQRLGMLQSSIAPALYFGFHCVGIRVEAGDDTHPSPRAPDFFPAFIQPAYRAFPVGRPQAAGVGKQ